MSVINEIAEERRRQVEVEGWSAEHDDQHQFGEMAAAASAYALAASLTDRMRNRVTGNNSIENSMMLRDIWPDSWKGWWKPKDRRRDLVRAAALIVAEIERLDRAGVSE